MPLCVTRPVAFTPMMQSAATGISLPTGVRADEVNLSWRNVPVKDLQMDEIWTFCKKKQGHLQPGEPDEEIGDAYTFIALEHTSKLVVAWHLGKRDRINTEDFISKVRWATADNRFEVCTDGFEPYVNAIDTGLYDRADYSQIIKVYSKQEEGRERYSPGDFVTLEKKAI